MQGRYPDKEFLFIPFAILCAEVSPEFRPIVSLWYRETRAAMKSKTTVWAAALAAAMVSIILALGGVAVVVSWTRVSTEAIELSVILPMMLSNARGSCRLPHHLGMRFLGSPTLLFAARPV